MPESKRGVSVADRLRGASFRELDVRLGNTAIHKGVSAKEWQRAAYAASVVNERVMNWCRIIVTGQDGHLLYKQSYLVTNRTLIPSLVRAYQSLNEAIRY